MTGKEAEAAFDAGAAIIFRFGRTVLKYPRINALIRRKRDGANYYQAELLDEHTHSAIITNVDKIEVADNGN